MEDIEAKYGIVTNADDIPTKFRRLVQSLHSSYGKKVVILIDEYDSPLTRNVSNQQLQDAVKAEMQGFYSGIKPLAEHIHFCMLTGVTKYGKLSIFSTLNNLDDISFDEAYSAICGITDAEIQSYLREGISQLAVKYKISYSEAHQKLKSYYDGYHFSESLIDVYNPFSVMSALSKERLGEYWFETGTPAMLVDFLRNPQKEIPELSGIRVRRETISNISLFQPQFVALLYQTGYLTIKAFDPDRERYTLDFPNREVRSGFFSSLLPIYSHLQRSESDIATEHILDAILDGQREQPVNELDSFLASIPSILPRSYEEEEDESESLSINKKRKFDLETLAQDIYKISEDYTCSDLSIKDFEHSIINYINTLSNEFYFENIDQIAECIYEATNLDEDEFNNTANYKKILVEAKNKAIKIKEI